MIARYGVVGLVVTATYFVLALTLSFALGVSAVTASALAYFFCIMLSYGLQSYITFRVRSHSAMQVGRFALTNTIGLVVSIVCVKLAEANGLSPIWGFVATSALIPALSFVVMLLWVFAPSQTALDVSRGVKVSGPGGSENSAELEK